MDDIEKELLKVEEELGDDIRVVRKAIKIFRDKKHLRKIKDALKARDMLESLKNELKIN